jgi:hypothetical protein
MTIRGIAAAVMLALSMLLVDTSCTAPPNCSAGEHAARMPSHQGHMWQCVPNGQQS